MNIFFVPVLSFFVLAFDNKSCIFRNSYIFSVPNFNGDVIYIARRIRNDHCYEIFKNMKTPPHFLRLSQAKNPCPLLVLHTFQF